MAAPSRTNGRSGIEARVLAPGPTTSESTRSFVRLEIGTTSGNFEITSEIKAELLLKNLT
jgi:hypothetical protein